MREQAMGRAETTELLSELLERDVLSGTHWAREVKYVKHNGNTGRVDYMSFKPREQRYGPTAASIEGGEFTAYEIKSCKADFESGHGLNFIAERNCIVCPMGLYKEIGDWAGYNDVSVYVPIPYYTGRPTTEQVYGSWANPEELTPAKGEWRLYKIRNQAIDANRRLSTAELLFAMLKAGRM